MKIYKPASWLVSINAYQWKSHSHKGGLIIRSILKPTLWECINKWKLKPANWLVSINAYQWKSAYC